MAEAPANPERDLAATYAPAETRAAFAALLALDDALAAVLRTTSEPALGQMRLVWWRDSLAALDAGPAPAMPVLEAVASEVLPRDVTGAALSAMPEGWMLLIEEEELAAADLERYADTRGGVLFRVAAQIFGLVDEPAEAAGGGWALVDLARHSRDEALAREALAIAAPLLETATRHRWSRRGRALGALAHLARLDSKAALRKPAHAGSPRRVGRLLWHRLTGR